AQRSDVRPDAVEALAERGRDLQLESARVQLIEPLGESPEALGRRGAQFALESLQLEVNWIEPPAHAPEVELRSERPKRVQNADDRQYEYQQALHEFGQPERQ